MFIKERFLLEVLLLFTLKTGLNGINVVLEAERQTENKYTTTGRSNASDQKAVHLYQGDKMYLEYCLTKNTLVQLKTIRYSNDGESDTLNVGIDSESVGTFETIPNFGGGQGWNMFQSFNLWNVTKFQSQGRHRIAIHVVKADKFGVEVDVVNIQLPQGNQDSFSFQCNLFCFDDIRYADEMKHKTVTRAKARVIQNSVTTLCAEEDNVNIPVFHESARQFVITATTPKYVSFLNNRAPDWRNCQMAGPFWKFKEFYLFDNFDKLYDSARMIGKWSDKGVWELNVEFSLEGQSTGSTDSEIGTIIHLILDGISGNNKIAVSLSYLDRYSRWSEPVTKTISSRNLNIYWETPDFTFKEGSGNKLRLQFQFSALNIQVRAFHMRKRYIRDDKSTEIFNDGMTIIEGVDYDMWWRINETMTVMIDNKNLYGNVDYLRIYQRSPWTHNGFSQVFVIYQDGNIRLLPMTPHGLDWVPFGSSVLLGQTDLHSKRPSAPISHINIDAAKLYMTIFFKDGGFISLQIKTTNKQTQLILSGAKYVKDMRTHPFLTFRSMWVADGNADVDHVTVDGTLTERIISDWTELTGTFVAFYRKCISTHNTLSPDITLNIIK